MPCETKPFCTVPENVMVPSMAVTGPPAHERANEIDPRDDHEEAQHAEREVDVPHVHRLPQGPRSRAPAVRA